MSKRHSTVDTNGNKLKCRVAGCDRDVLGRMLCGPHYHKNRLYGDPLRGGVIVGEPKKFLLKLIASNPDGCVTWPFATSRGYAYMQWRGRYQSVSRLVLALTKGEPPDPSMEAAHKCGKGRQGCVSPHCLYWATKQQNIDDRILHRSGFDGDRFKSAKLTSAIVKAVRSSNGKGKDTAQQFGISCAQVSRIRARKTWAWLE